MIKGQVSIFEDEKELIDSKSYFNKKKNKKAVSEDNIFNSEEREFMLNFINYYRANLIKWHVDENNLETVENFINNIRCKLNDPIMNFKSDKTIEVKSVKNLIKEFYKEF